MIRYYRSADAIYASPVRLFMPEITKEEYEQVLESLQPTREEIQEAKEAQLTQLLDELYPSVQKADILAVLNKPIKMEKE